MNIKSNIQLLSEAAAADLKLNTEAIVGYDAVREAYSAIPEAPEPVVTEASDVLITKTANDEYYVEMLNLAPFMMDTGITDISEALDLVAAANGLQPRQVGLCIESQARVDAVLEAARKKSKETKDPKPLKKAVEKIDKNNAVAAKLMKKGYKVVKKGAAKVCPHCGKLSGKCKCEFAPVEEACGGKNKPKVKTEEAKDSNKKSDDRPANHIPAGTRAAAIL